METFAYYLSNYMSKVFEVTYGTNTVHYSFIYPGTKRLFKRYIRLSESETYDIRAVPRLIEKERKFLPADSKDNYVEYRALIGLTAKYLLRYKACIFHSVSFMWKGYAWLLSAPSGTGKTTQYMNWTRLFPNEIQMISGDMPVLELSDDGLITVYPTSWNGKEDIGNMIHAPLGGLIYLAQGDCNQFNELKPADGVYPIFNQFIVRPDTFEEIQTIAEITETLFLKYPVLRYTNKGDDESTILLRKMINDKLKKMMEAVE